MIETRKFYLTVPKSVLDDILINGITPGINDGKLDRLPFLRGEIEKPPVGTGHAAYLEIEIPDDDPRYIEVNRRQCEYHDYVPVEQITALAYPPGSNEEVIDLFEAYDGDAKNPEFKKNWEFHDLNRETDETDETEDLWDSGNELRERRSYWG
jgi:hypothetical protein